MIATAAQKPGGQGLCRQLVVANESVRTLPTSRAVVDRAKMIYVLDGRARIKTAFGTMDVSAGDAYSIGAGNWCSVHPQPSVRIWTLYIDEEFLRSQLGWFLPDKARLRDGINPEEWEGHPVVLHPGLDILKRAEPLWRQISVLDIGAIGPEAVAVRSVMLLAHAAELFLPCLLDSAVAPSVQYVMPLGGRLTAPSSVGQIGIAVRLLRSGLAEDWSCDRLAAEVALSPSHLSRLFGALVGTSPMRLLTEFRLTEFTRIIEETDASIADAARAVGWADARVAAAWFRRRFGMTPSRYRLHPHKR